MIWHYFADPMRPMSVALAKSRATMRAELGYVAYAHAHQYERFGCSCPQVRSGPASVRPTTAAQMESEGLG